MELTINRTTKTFQEELQDLLSKKDKLAKQDAGDGRNKYQVEINKLKKKIKEYNKDLKNNEPKVKFNSLLQGVKKKEREGKFDRGAEGKAKNKLRKKMAKQAEDIFTSGRHKGSQAGDYIDKGMSKMDSKATVKLSQDLTGTKKKKKPNKVNLGSR
jgi:hypothetical protein